MNADTEATYRISSGNARSAANVGGRIASLDLVRGVVMILMALDHVRVFSGIPAGGQTAGLFFTRWVTNFSAPAFVFLAGTSAYLLGQKLGNRTSLSRFLIVRGLWLIALELTILRISWTFNFDFAHYLLAGVIWMIGWSMVLLAAAVYLPTPVVGMIGVAIIALHNLTDLFPSQIDQAFGTNGPDWLLSILYFGGEVKLGASGPPLLILYVIVPWVGVMFAGYAFGRVAQLPRAARARICFRLGSALTVAFIALRLVGLYGDPRPWGKQHLLFSFLSTTKYPASLEFLLMTLGPVLILWTFAERWRGKLASVIETFGRVPLFFYLLHIPLIHFAACLVSIAREGRIDPWLFANHPLAAGPAPGGYMWSLGLLYLVYALCLAALYLPCREYARMKKGRQSAWLSML